MKSPLLSKTLWMNLIVAAAAFIPVAQSYISGHPSVFAIGFAAANFILRLVTKQAIGLSDS